MFDVMLCFCLDKIETYYYYYYYYYTTIYYFLINKKKWSGTKPTFLLFINEFQQCSNLLFNIKNDLKQKSHQDLEV